MLSGKDGKADVEKIAVAAGSTLGGVAGAAALGVAGANITAAAAATSASVSAAAGAGAFAPFLVTVTHPATWAIALSNPIGAVAVVGGLTTLGGFAAYKVIKKALDD